ncbi:dTMP kinase [Pseudolysinimonas yzui]|uniref:dTMP kinase n=1 Tax=Pseudolysinimonas yzui TaxID=2708254 RepID=UPI00174E3951|nr:dTMP kinase [Pseudolysinimonas yzui]
MRSGRGRFIVLEGLDGAGTTTQGALLAARLIEHGLPVDLTKEPTDGAIGRIARAFTDGDLHLEPETVALTFAADRIEHTVEIRGALDAGTWVVSDRYVASSLAYQTSQGLPFEWVRTLNSRAMEPDATVFVDTSVAACVARLESRGEFNTGPFDQASALQKARDLYLQAFASDVPLGRLIEVDGDASREEVADAIWDALAPLR